MQAQSEKLREELINITESSSVLSRNLYLIKRLDYLTQNLQYRIVMLRHFLEAAKNKNQDKLCIQASYKILEFYREIYGLTKQKIQLAKQAEQQIRWKEESVEKIVEDYANAIGKTNSIERYENRNKISQKYISPQKLNINQKRGTNQKCPLTKKKIKLDQFQLRKPEQIYD